MRIGVVVSSAGLTQATHTTVHLVEAALAVGHAVRVFEPWDFELDARGRMSGRAHCFDAPHSRESVVAALHGRTAPRRFIEAAGLDVLLLRSNPLQDAVVTFGQLAQAAGVRVLNDPRTLLRTSHKGYALTFPGLDTPASLVTRSLSAAERFAMSFRDGVVVKPARAGGGRGVSLVRGRRRVTDLGDALKAATAASGDGYAVVQAYLPAADEGEKRLLWLDGALIGGYLRRRAPGEFRHNLKVGGLPEPCEVTATDLRLAAALTAGLRRDGVWFAGLDVIGGHVVEINTLNPGGAHYTTLFTGIPVGRLVIESLAPPATLQPPLTAP